MESIKWVIENFLPEFAGTIVEHAAYPFQVENKARDLESATRDLVAMKEDVRTSIEIAERQNGSRTKQATEWLNKVDAIKKEVEEIQENNRKRRWSFWANYTTGRSAVKKLRQVKNLCDQKGTIEVTMPVPPPLAQEMPASSSKSSYLESALQYVKDDMHGIIGIWGMGVVGKTHLLKQINNKLSGDLTGDDVVVFVTCSKECNEEKVQNEIIRTLGLENNCNIQQKQSAIFSFLKKRNFALLLDDLWSRVDLETIGIPNPLSRDHTYKRKVVLTTRSTEVCGQMEVKNRIKVDVLNWDDAWSLFREKATEETINSNPRIQSHAVKVVNELGGLPLALITVGRAMYDKLDPSEWEQAVLLLKQARLNDVEFQGTNQSVFHILRFSYDSLKNDTLRQCFLHCSLWPEDDYIRKDNLVELWMGLGLIDELDIHVAYNIGFGYIKRLQAVCLLEDGSHNDLSFKMHDVIRDMALWIASNQGVETKKWIVRAGTYKKPQMMEVSCETEKLSVMKNNTKNFSLSTTSSSTKLSTLLHTHTHLEDSKIIRLELFPKLTVLDLSNNKLDVFPVEICKLVELQFLNLSWNHNLKSLPEELAALTNLKYLYLRGTSCIYRNRVISKLKALKVLDSSLCQVYHNMELFPTLEEDLQYLPGFQSLGISISCMTDLQKLSQTISVPVRWLEVYNYRENKLSFSSCFLGNSQLQSNLLYLTMSRSDVEYVEFEGASENQSIYHLGRLEIFIFETMNSMKEIIWKNLDPKDVFPRLKHLVIWRCNNLRSISWIVNLPCIQQLTVHKCGNVKQLIYINELEKSGISTSLHSFPFLKIIYLAQLLKLERISDPLITFPTLEFLKVYDCIKLMELPFRTGNPPGKLKLIEGSEEWWNNVEMKNESHRSSLQPLFRKVKMVNTNRVTDTQSHKAFNF